MVKAEVRSSLITTTDTTRAPKVGFELATNSIRLN